jgi:hypothetical protein
VFSCHSFAEIGAAKTKAAKRVFGWRNDVGTGSVIFVTIGAERIQVHLVTAYLHKTKHLVAVSPCTRMYVAGAAGYSPVVYGQGSRQEIGVHFIDINIAGMTSLPDKETLLALQPNAAAIFPDMAEQANLVDRPGKQTISRNLVTVSRIHVPRMAIAAVVRNTGIMGIRYC